MDLIQAFVLGIVQGLTEFLPISSSAHLVFVPWFLGWNGAAITSLQFDVALHMGTLVAVIGYFWSDWVRYIRALFQSIAQRRIGDDLDRRMIWFLLIGSIPAAIVGGIGESKINDIFHDPANLKAGLLIIGILLIVMGFVMLLSERMGRHIEEMQDIRLGQSIGIGFAQALALIPGVSRSGATITAGLFYGLTRETAARFSFLLATPVILGAGLKAVYDLTKQPGGIPADEQMGFIVGFLAAAISGFLCIRFLLRYLQRGTMAPFIWYRWIIGIALIVLVLIGYRV